MGVALQAREHRLTAARRLSLAAMVSVEARLARLKAAQRLARHPILVGHHADRLRSRAAVAQTALQRARGVDCRRPARAAHQVHGLGPTGRGVRAGQSRARCWSESARPASTVCQAASSVL